VVFREPMLYITVLMLEVSWLFFGFLLKAKQDRYKTQGMNIVKSEE